MKIDTSAIDSVIKKVNGVQKEQLERKVAALLLPEIKKRIHVRGENALGSKIGTYSKSYMVYRTGSFGNSEKVSKGKNKGKLKNAGFFTKSANAGKKRPTFPKHPTDPQVTLSLTRNMENDFRVVSDGGVIGVGFNNPKNFLKATGQEKNYNQTIYGATPTEYKIALDYVNKIVNG